MEDFEAAGFQKDEMKYRDMSKIREILANQDSDSNLRKKTQDFWKRTSSEKSYPLTRRWKMKQKKFNK